MKIIFKISEAPSFTQRSVIPTKYCGRKNFFVENFKNNSMDWSHFIYIACGMCTTPQQLMNYAIAKTGTCRNHFVPSKVVTPERFFHSDFYFSFTVVILFQEVQQSHPVRSFSLERTASVAWFNTETQFAQLSVRDESVSILHTCFDSGESEFRDRGWEDTRMRAVLPEQGLRIREMLGGEMYLQHGWVTGEVFCAGVWRVSSAQSLCDTTMHYGQMRFAKQYIIRKVFRSSRMRGLQTWQELSVRPLCPRKMRPQICPAKQPLLLERRMPMVSEGFSMQTRLLCSSKMYGQDRRKLGSLFPFAISNWVAITFAITTAITTAITFPVAFSVAFSVAFPDIFADAFSIGFVKSFAVSVCTESWLRCMHARKRMRFWLVSKEKVLEIWCV